MTNEQFYKGSTFLLLYYCYLGCLKKITFPASSITMPMLFVLVLGIVFIAGKGKIYFFDQFDKIMCFSWIIIAVYIIMNNYNLGESILNGGLIQLFVMIAFMLFSYNKTGWIDTWKKYSKIFILIHAISTIVFYYNKGLYVTYINLFQSPSDIADLMNYYNSGEMAGLVSHFSSNGMILSVGLIIFFESIIYNKEKEKFGYRVYGKVYDYVGILLVIYALILSSKRGPFLAAVLAIAVTFTICKRKNIVKRIFLLLIFASVVLVCYKVLLPYIPGLSTLADKTNKLTSSDAGLLNGRLGLWAIAFQMFNEAPILGHGYGSYAAVSEMMSAITTSAHNYYLQILAELGLVGLILYLIVFISALVFTIKAMYLCEGLKEDTNMKLASCCRISMDVQIFVLIYSMTSTSMIYYSIMIPFFLACATPRAVYNKIEVIR